MEAGGAELSMECQCSRHRSRIFQISVRIPLHPDKVGSLFGSYAAFHRGSHLDFWCSLLFVELSRDWSSIPNHTVAVSTKTRFRVRMCHIQFSRPRGRPNAFRGSFHPPVTSNSAPCTPTASYDSSGVSFEFLWPDAMRCGAVDVSFNSRLCHATSVALFALDFPPASKLRCQGRISAIFRALLPAKGGTGGMERGLERGRAEWR
ncbi:hypothetical protein B0H13DRAFT_360623 [Mycena leptocephala]|nr:hypothetical protein B0H13DRAFT_360623 [Mycena leptocephala]